MKLNEFDVIIFLEVMKVLTEERQNFILEKIKRDNMVKIKDLEQELNCSISTVRRDLLELEEKNLLVRIHGGAKRIYTLAEELEVKEKSTKNVQEKVSIAELAASYVNENDVIFLDAGTTTYEMIPFLQRIKGLLVVTNGVKHADYLIDHGISAILIGGQIKPKTKAIIGSVALSQLAQYRFNKSFLGINGIDIEFGYTTPDPEEALLKNKAASLSNKTFILADHTKFDKVNFAKVGELEDYLIVTNKLKEKTQKRKTDYEHRTKVLEASK